MPEELKYRLLNDRFQLLELTLEGEVRRSCDTLLPFQALKQSVREELAFFNNQWRIWQRLDVGQSLWFYDVRLELSARVLQTDIQVSLCHEEEQTFFRFLIEDRTAFYHEQHQQQAEHEATIEGQRLELLNEILELKQRNQQLQENAERLEQEAHQRFWALWHERTTPVFALAEHTTESHIAHWFTLLQKQLEAHLRGAHPSHKEVFRPASVWPIFRQLWQSYADLQGFSTHWEIAEEITERAFRGDVGEWKSWLVAVFSELIRARHKVESVHGTWHPDRKCIRTVWRGDFSVPLHPLTAWESTAHVEQHPDALYLDYPMERPDQTPNLTPHVLFYAASNPHNERIFRWIRAENAVATWIKPEETTKNTENFDLLITENTENPYISAFNAECVWLWQAADKPIRRQAIQAFLSSQNSRATMISNQSLDLSYIREIVDDQPEMMLNLLGILEKNLEEYPEKMQREWREGDLPALRETAHKFKSCTAYTNLDEFNQALSRIESSDENGMTTEEIKTHLDAVTEVSQHVLEQVRQSKSEIN